MDRKAVTERLHALASDDTKRSKAARLRDVIDDVEATLAAGVPRSLIVEELAALGLTMTLATFETTLKRIREKRGKPLPKAKSASPQPLVKTITESENTMAGSHDPTELDKIINNKPDLVALAKLAKRKTK